MKAKRNFFVLLALLVAVAGFSTPVVEEVITEITFLSTQNYEGNEMVRYAVDKFHEDYPGVEVRTLMLDLSTGSTMTMDALHEADLRPNIYWDHPSRVSKFMIPGYAFPLDDAIRDLDQYNDGTFDLYRKDGVLYGMPLQGNPNAMAINLNIMADIGYTVPDNWTIDDFLEMCELVKQFYGGEKFGTMMYAKTMSGDYQINTWWGAFGARLFAPGDYSRTTIRETGGAKVHEFYQTLQREGYIEPDSAMLDDGYSFGAFGEGKYAAIPFFGSSVGHYMGLAVDRGFEPFEYTFVEFPSATGEPVPVYSAGAAMIVIETGTAADAIAARLVEYLNDATAQSFSTLRGGPTANRKDFIVESTNPYTALCSAIAAENGLQDIGLLSPFASAVRAQHFPILQRVLNFELTPEKSIKLYEIAVNEALNY